MELQATGLTVRRGQRWVLSNVDISATEGECVGILGPNGAGKTTCFGCLTGRIPLDSGTVRVANRCVDGLAPYARARLGLAELPQSPSFFRGLTAQQNIELILELRTPASTEERQRKAWALLEQLGISARANDRAEWLSGGERRRLEIARVLALPPRVLLLDEPFAGVDPKTVAELATLIRGLPQKTADSSQPAAVILTDHDARTVLKVCDRVLLLLDGSIVAQGAPEDLLKDPIARESYLGFNFQL